MANPKWIIVHHAGGSDSYPLQDSSNFTFEMCNKLHQERFNMMSSLGWYVGYQYYIEKDGSVRQGRSDVEEGAHTVGRNYDSIGICLAGNFDATLPTKAQELALKNIVEAKMKQWSIPIDNVVPHRKFATKTCFGKKLADNWVQKLVTPKTDTVALLLKKLNEQIGAKDYKGAKDTTSYLFNELTKL